MNRILKKILKLNSALILISLLIGITIGFFIFKITDKENKIKRHDRVVQLLISNSGQTKTWNNVTLEEGESVLNLVKRVSEVEGLDLILDGEGRDQRINTLLGTNIEGGEWKYYINNANPLPTIGRYFPKDGDVVSVIYTKNN